MTLTPQQELDLERLEMLRKHARAHELRSVAARNANEARDACVSSDRHKPRAEAWTLLQQLLEPSR